MNDKTMVMEWYYVTPCGHCGKPIRIAKDPSCGQKRYADAAALRLTCKDCGHQDSYPPTAVDNRLVG